MQYNQLKFELYLVKLFIVIRNMSNEIKIMFESKHFDGTFNEGLKLELIKKKLILNNFDLTQVDQENILAQKK